MKLIHVILLVFIGYLFSCSGPNYKDNPLMQKAFAIHQEASKVEQEIAPKMENLVQVKNSTNTVGRALTEAEMTRIEQIERIEQSLKYSILS